MNRHAMKAKMHRKDSTQKEIVAAIKADWSSAKVQDTSMVGGGFPDLVVILRPLTLKAQLVFVECKTPEHPELTPAEILWHREWKDANIVIARSGHEAVAIMRGMLLSK